jgi:HlyD family secretion protein
MTPHPFASIARSSRSPFPRAVLLGVLAVAGSACEEAPPTDHARVSGQVEATEVSVSAQVAGRVTEVRVDEGDRVEAGQLLVTLDTADAQLTLARARAERAQADAQWRLLRAGSRAEDVRQAEAQVASATADVAAQAAELAAAEADVQRFESLLATNSGSRKQRDDAVARRDVARERHAAAGPRVAAAQENVRRLRSGARPEEIEAAHARVAAAEAQIAIVEKSIADATISAPLSGIVTERIVEPGEHVLPRAPLLVISDLDRVWANVYVDEPVVPRLRVGQAATIFTDAGGEGLQGTVSAIAQKAEFTPRNVQTAEDRSKLVYRVKVAVDNKSQVLKSGMPVEAELPFDR